MSAAKGKRAAVAELAIDLLDPHPSQPRASVGDVSALAESIQELGILQPVLTLANGDRYTIVAGHRRVAAAKKAKLKTVPSIVLDDSVPADQLKALLAENTNRSDLTALEEAAGIQTLLKLEVSPVAVAKALGRSVDQVNSATAIAKKAPKLAKELDGKQATLEEAAALADFADDTTWRHDQLVRAIGTRDFPHTLQRIRDDRDRELRVQAATDKLVRLGVALLPESKRFSGGVMRLSSVRVKGKEVSLEEHASCPGHAAYVEHGGEVTYYCTQPAAHGLKTSSAPERDKELDKLKREARAAHKSATVVRHDHIRTVLLIARPKADVQVASFTWASEAAWSHGLTGIEASYAVESKIAKALTEGLKLSNPQRIVALAIASVEKVVVDSIKYGGGVAGSGTSKRTQEYFAMLEATGYTLSDVERAYIGKKVRP